MNWRILVAAALVALIGCGDDDIEAPPPALEDFVSGVTLTMAFVFPDEPAPLSIAAVRRPGAPPAQNLGPSGFGCPVLRSEVRQPAGRKLTCETGAYARTDPLQKFYVWVGNVDGYWEVTLPEPLGSLAYGVSLSYDVQISPDAPVEPFYLRTSGTDTGGRTGVTTNQRIELQPAPVTPEHPDVEVVLTWTGSADLDLHVVDPFGHDVSVFAPETPQGVVFSGDGQGACIEGSVNRESITWPGNTAPGGQYEAYVVYHAQCGEGASSFTASVTVTGSERTTDGGAFDGPATPEQRHDLGTFTFP